MEYTRNTQDNFIHARVKLTDYTNRVLGVIKAKYNLTDKSEALNKFVEIYGVSEVEPEINSKYLEKISKLESDHLKKYGLKKMSKKELDKLFNK